MPGLLAVSWKQGCELQANESFERMSLSFAKFKGLTCSSDVRTAGFRIARFAGQTSPYPDVLKDTRKNLIVASAGWWCEQDVARHHDARLIYLADRYHDEGDRVFNGLFGQYVIVVIDIGNQTLIASVDRLGFFPVYIAERDGLSWLSTSSTVLASVLKTPLDIEAVRALFMNDSIRSPATAFRGIRRLEFGEQVTFSEGKCQIKRVWTPYRDPVFYRKIEDAAEQAVYILRSCCRGIRKLFSNAICDLTSGLDSRLVVSAFTEPGSYMNVTVNGDDDHLDVVVASQIAQHFGWTCFRGSRPTNWGQLRWPYFQKAAVLTEGELAADHADATLMGKARLAKEFDASLTGGMGEICRDFFWQQEFFKIGKTCHLDVARLCRYRFFFNCRPDMSLFKRDWRKQYMHEQVNLAQQIADLAPDACNTAKLDTLYIWKNCGHVGRYVGACFPIIPSMVPLGTQPFVEFCMSVPYQYRLGGKLVRHIITKTHPDLAKFPTWYGGSAEPLCIRKPVNYVPYLTNVFKKGVRKAGQLTIKKPIFKDPCAHRVHRSDDIAFLNILQTEGWLDIDNLKTSNLYDPDGLQNFLKQARSSKFNLFSQLYPIISLELLCRRTGIRPSGQSL